MSPFSTIAAGFLRRFRWSVLGALVIVGASLAHGQLTPHAPVANFRLPFFGLNGERQWEVRGREAVRQADGTFAVQGLELRLFAQTDGAQTETTLRSERALLDPAANRATGDTPLQVSSPTYVIDGAAWQWEGATRRLRLTGGVRAVFSQSMPSLVLP